MKKIFLSCVFCSLLLANEAEQMFWDEVKNSNDIELLKLYKKKYPNGIFESLADIKIKRLQKVDVQTEAKPIIPNWIKGETSDYKFYGVGKAIKNFKGEEYQRSLAKKRAQRVLDEKFLRYKLTSRQILEYSSYISTQEYKDEKERIYILLYIDNENIL